jgi:hypothetical protein
MYTNIPKTDTTNIINNILRNNHETNNNTREEIMHLVHLVTEQNYFQFDKQYYKETEGLAMGDSTSAILAEAYIQHIEHTQIYSILTKQKSIAYYRYVDDIIIVLMCYNDGQKDKYSVLNECNRMLKYNTS